MVKISTTGPFPKIRVRNSKIHGRGVFAGQRIAKGQTIVEYVGEKITSAEGTKRSESHPTLSYIFTLNSKYDIDGNVNGNGAQFINHSCEPNAEVDIIKDRIWIYALKDIKKGEEIHYDYSFDADEIIICRCQKNGSIGKCRGYINDPDTIPKIKRALARAKKKKSSKRKK